ncbi:MAG: malto-oligosyltrehalose trehalohydrolase [Deltaproteobacteria bacterium RBG_16_47_11]|nr:MAG: malto-oligosyltrehalose trehalohydrolase [Deltaproteobacteria bacterium RBG_16_47_11]
MKKKRTGETVWALDLGANVTDQGVRFRVWAPKASSVSLVIMGEKEPHLMNPEDRGYFSTFIQGLEPGRRYCYLLNEDRPRPDPVSRFQPEGVHGPSEVIDPSKFKWEDQSWNGIPLQEMIIYEIHTGTFTPEGTFEAIIPFLDYLEKDLGVTAIELMPITQFPGERNWGYDGAYLYAPPNSYGGPHGLKSLVNACHRIGLAVIHDGVYNHLGPEGNYLGEYGPYFTDRYKTPWGPAVNFDGPESDEVRKFVIDNALYWITEYHMDGLRIDAIHGIFDFSARHILDEIRESVHKQARRLGRHIVVVAESDLNDVRVINPPAKGGYGLDAQWNDDFHHCLHTLLTGEQKGYYQDFGNFNQLVKALREGFVYNGQYSSFRKRRHGNSSKHLPPTKFVIFSQNHDQVGNRLKGDRLSTLVSFEALKLAAGIVLLSPNIPLLFMGEEYGEEAPFLYFVSHSDPELIEAVRKGRREEFAAFQWDGEIPEPQDEATFSRSKIHLDLRHDEKHEILLEFYKTLIRLRKEIPSLSALDKKGIEIKAFEKEKVILINRECEEDRTICIFNFSDKPIKVETAVEKGSWEKIFASASEEWGGMGPLVPESILSSGSEVIFVLDAHAFAVYRKLRET